MPIDWDFVYILSVLVFIVLVAGYVIIDWKNFKREFIVLLRRTQKGKRTVEKIGSSHPKFWKGVGYLGVAAGFYASVFVFITLIQNLVRVASVGGPSGLSLVLPSPFQTVSTAPGVLAVPFWYWIIAIGLLVVVHEGMHGILSAAHKIKIKSLGWGLFLVIPLAFVEPDEKQLQKRKTMTQMHIFAVGSLANFFVAFLCVLIATFAFSGVFSSSGVSFQSVIKDYPAQSVNMTGVITSISAGQEYTIKSLDDLSSALKQIGPEKEIIVKTITPNASFHPQAVFSERVFDKISSSPIGFLNLNNYFDPSPLIVLTDRGQEKSYTVKTVGNPDIPEAGFIGISGLFEVKEYTQASAPYAPAIGFVHGLIFFLFLINLGVGLANMMPIKPLDGGRMWDVLFKKIHPKRAKDLITGISYLTLLLIIANFVFPLIRF